MAEITFLFDVDDIVYIHDTIQRQICPQKTFLAFPVQAVRRDRGINYYLVNNKWYVESSLLSESDFVTEYEEDLENTQMCLEEKIANLE